MAWTYACIPEGIQYCNYICPSVRKPMSSEIIESFSSGRLSATMSVRATSMPFVIGGLPSYPRSPLRARKCRKRQEPMRLLPSEKGWSFTTR